MEYAMKFAKGLAKGCLEGIWYGMALFIGSAIFWAAELFVKGELRS